MSDRERLRVIVRAFKDCNQLDDPNIEALVAKQFFYETLMHATPQVIANEIARGRR